MVKVSDDAKAKMMRVRAHDGIHLSADGAGVVKRHVLKTILPILDGIKP